MQNEELLFGNEETDSSETTEKYEAAKKELIARCKSAKIEFEEFNLPEYFAEAKGIKLFLPAGRDKRMFRIYGLGAVKKFLSISFEEFTFLGDYLAICSYSKGSIEAAIRPLGIIGPSSIIYRKLLGRSSTGQDVNPQELTLSIARPGTEQSESMSIGPATSELVTLSGPSAPHTPSISLKITGIQIARHDQALEYLEKLSNSLFFEIDLVANLALVLSKVRKPVGQNRIAGIRTKRVTLQFPQFEYDREPISLYWYARSATGMPLLQFLAYYQAIEFYFPAYSQKEAARRIQNILKEPAFSPHRDSDLGRLLAVIKPGGGRGFGDERAQLRATLQECLDSDALREFLSMETTRKDFFTSKSKALSSHKLPIANLNADLRADVADRIYNIRCKIVHTKTGGGEGDIELLLPFSKEAELLSFDIELIQYVAQKVLIASSTELKV